MMNFTFMVSSCAGQLQRKSWFPCRESCPLLNCDLFDNFGRTPQRSPKIESLKQRLVNILRGNSSVGPEEFDSGLRRSLWQFLNDADSEKCLKGFLQYIQENYPEDDLATVEFEDIRRALCLLLCDKKREIQESLKIIEEDPVGNYLFRGLRRCLRGKIRTVPDAKNQFQHPEKDSSIQLKLDVLQQTVALPYVDGVNCKTRPLDVTLFHELLHGYHYYSEQEVYRYGLEKINKEQDNSLEQQLSFRKLSLTRTIANLFEVNETIINKDWLQRTMTPWLSANGNVFLFEELRTIWGNRNASTLVGKLSESAYLWSRGLPELIRVGYQKDFDEDCPWSVQQRGPWVCSLKRWLTLVVQEFQENFEQKHMNNTCF